MNKIFLLFCFFAIIAIEGCSIPEKEPSPAASKFMNRDEIMEQINAFTEKDEMDGPLTEEEKKRESNLIPDKVFLNDMPSQIKSFTREEITAADPDQVDLRYRDTKVKSQDNGKCTAFAGVAAMENMLNASSPRHELSAWHAWSFYRQYSSSAFIKAATKNRVGDEKDYPQYGKSKASLKPHALITKQTYISDDTTAMVKALGKGQVVYLAMKTPKSMLKCDKVISPYSAASSGGHALLISGYYLDSDKKPVAIIKNSWGAKCGDNGYQYLPMSLCFKKGYYCSMWAIEEVNSNLAISNVDPVDVTPTPEIPKTKKVCRRVWYKPWVKVCTTVSA